MTNNATRSLTPEQAAAVADASPSLVVRASAGTGKTTTLVARYLRHVTQDDLRPDQILTITFTRKAAAEMKRRIVDELVKHGLRDEAQVAETGPVQTIHGFCERILRECSVDAGLDPEFDILDETEAARRMKAAIVDAVGTLAETPLSQELTHRLAGKVRYGASEPHSLLQGAIENVVAKLRGSTSTLDELDAKYRDPEQCALSWRDRILESTPAAVREALAEVEAGHPFGVRLGLAYKVAKVKSDIRLPTPSASEEAQRADDDMTRLACGLMQIACHAWRTFEDRNIADHALDFVELERRTVELLQSSEPAKRRVQNQYKVVLVDESQDMNPIQHRLLETMGIAQEMLVGDAQQSIYGFRQADVRLFEAKASRASVKQLSANKRSTQGLLRFVDDLFARIWEGDYVPMSTPADDQSPGYEGVEFWIQKNKDTAQIAAWIGEVLETEQPKDVAVLVRTGRYAQDLLGYLEAFNVPARIAGGSERYYTRLEVRDLSNALDALLQPQQDFSLLAVLHSPIVGLSLDSLVLLASGGGVFAKLAEFDPPWARDRSKIAEFLAWFSPLSEFADRLSAAELLGAILTKSPYLPTLAKRTGGVQTIANVRKLFSIAAGMPEASPSEFSRRLREIREIRHHEGDAPASEDEQNLVTILTIHKAKGLEFPVVVVPDLQGRVQAMQEVEIDRSGMLTVKFGEGLSIYHAYNTHWRKQRDIEERYRLLYVALTRARRRLCLSIHPGGSNITLAGDIPDRMGWKEGLPEGLVVKREARDSQSENERMASSD